MTLAHIGRSQRSSTSGFVFGCSVPAPEVPLFGSFVRAPIQQAQAQVVGLIYDIVIQDDQFVRPLIAADERMGDAEYEIYLQDQRQRMQVPLEVSVLTVGYRNSHHSIHMLPPQPPMLLDKIHYCTDEEIRAFTDRLDFLQLILASPLAPSDALIAAALPRAAATHPDRAQFLRAAGRALARLLARDLPRLEKLLQQLRP
jgi:hypothetical protein